MAGTDTQDEFHCSCGIPFVISEAEGKHQCEHCGETLWYLKSASQRATATSQELETTFGFEAADLDDLEMLELLGRHSGLYDDWQQWSLEQLGRRPVEWQATGESQGTLNPYQPPQTDPVRTDAMGDSYVLIGLCPCDETSMRWAHRNYVRSGDAFALCMVLIAGVAMAVCILLGDWMKAITAQIGILGWVGIFALIMPLWYCLGRLCLVPLARALDRRASEDPLLQQDWFWLVIRRRTLTVSDQAGGHRKTWPLKNILPGHSDSALLVLRTDPGAKLFITAAAQTRPESFDEFAKAVKKRLRKFWWEHLKSFRLR